MKCQSSYKQHHVLDTEKFFLRFKVNGILKSLTWPTILISSDKSRWDAWRHRYFFSFRRAQIFFQQRLQLTDGMATFTNDKAIFKLRHYMFARCTCCALLLKQCDAYRFAECAFSKNTFAGWTLVCALSPKTLVDCTFAINTFTMCTLSKNIEFFVFIHFC